MSKMDEKRGMGNGEKEKSSAEIFCTEDHQGLFRRRFGPDADCVGYDAGAYLPD